MEQYVFDSRLKPNESDSRLKLSKVVGELYEDLVKVKENMDLTKQAQYQVNRFAMATIMSRAVIRNPLKGEAFRDSLGSIFEEVKNIDVLALFDPGFIASVETVLGIGYKSPVEAAEGPASKRRRAAA